ncbi:TPA: hypothetical protein ACH3X1_007158 [Trebouxia sp. C0004]
MLTETGAQLSTSDLVGAAAEVDANTAASTRSGVTASALPHARELASAAEAAAAAVGTSAAAGSTSGAQALHRHAVKLQNREKRGAVVTVAMQMLLPSQQHTAWKIPHSPLP